MIKYSKIPLTVASVLVLTACQDDKTVNTEIKNSLNEDIVDGAIVITDQDIIGRYVNAASVVLTEEGSSEKIYGQRDDLDQDGQPDELFFLINLSGNENKNFIINSAEAAIIDPRTKATISVKQNGFFDDKGVYISKGGYVMVNSFEVPQQQEQDSKLVYMEGPLWESDKIGFRYYLDDRNRYDVFGKAAPEMVLHNLTGDYHALSEWGADVLKVGKSMGLGSIAMMTDQGSAFISNVETKHLDIMANGPFRSILRTEYKGWRPNDSNVDVISDLEIRAGAHWTEQRLTVTGLGPQKMATGIVKHAAAAQLITGIEEGIFFAYTWGEQSEQSDFLGMAILMPQEFSPEIVLNDPNSHLITYKLIDEKAHYRFMAGWEHEVVPFKTREDFDIAVRKAARRYAHPLTYKTLK